MNNDIKDSNEATSGSHYGSFDRPPEQVALTTVNTDEQPPPKPAQRRIYKQKQQQPVNHILATTCSSKQAPSLTFGISGSGESSGGQSVVDKTSDIVEEIRRVHLKRQKQLEQQQQQHILPELVNLSSPLTLSSENKQQVLSSSAPATNSNRLPELENQQQQQTIVQNRMKNSMTLPIAGEEEQRKEQSHYQRAYPKQVFFIVVSEFCERFSYYGLRAVLVLYLTGVLNFSDRNATVAFHLFAALCYVTPILGAVLGDSIWGKFKTILYLSLVYLIGELVLTTSSVFWNLSGNLSTILTAIGLILIGIGTGGIKPCVGALGGDQFRADEDKWRSSFFSLFYATINLGSLISMFVTPILRSQFQCVGRQDCFPYAFALPSALMFIAIIAFAVAKRSYNLVPLPERNVIVAFFQCIWIALKRKVSTCCCNASQPNYCTSHHQQVVLTTTNHHQLDNRCLELSSDSSSSHSQETTSGSSNGEATSSHQNLASGSSLNKQVVKSLRSNHWLYLANDHFDEQSIEDFRSVLAVLLLAVPLPVYWCLYDQQGSLWTLQATRMDGHLFTGWWSFELQPDQMSVFNPLLMLTLIPIFEVFIYPTLAKFNLLTKPIPRMATGGLLAALAFVLSALIEVSILQHQPVELPPMGTANLLLVNGVGANCRIANAEISYVPVPGQEAQLLARISAMKNQTTGGSFASSNYPPVEPLGSLSLDLLSTGGGGNQTSGANQTGSANLTGGANYLNNYKLKFTLSDATPEGSVVDNQVSNTNNKCPFSAQQVHEFNFGPFAHQAMRLLYVEQGNGKVTFKVFNESLRLPEGGKARVRLLYESFGSLAQSEKRNFSLIRLSSTGKQSTIENINKITNGSVTSTDEDLQSNKLKFEPEMRNGQVFLSQYMEVAVPTSGGLFSLQISDNNQLLNNQLSEQSFQLKTATRNLIVVTQRSSTNVQLKHNLLQDNTYRISMLYQLAPYLVMSISEVMMSITGLQFSYSVAPENMKSVVMALWSVVVAFGNMLTVAIEAMHFFPSVVHDFLFYATLMTIDMFFFAILGYYFKPYTSNSSGKNKMSNHNNNNNSRRSSKL